MKCSDGIQYLRWLEKARAHLFAAELIACNPRSKEIGPTDLPELLLMLVGFAIENLVKARMHVDESDYQSTVSAGKLRGSVKSHNLLELVSSTGFPVTKSDRTLLDGISEAVTWTGRYPTPLRAGAIPASQHRPSMSDAGDLLRRLVHHLEAISTDDSSFQTAMHSVLPPWWSE